MIKGWLKGCAKLLRTVADSLEGIDDESSEEPKPDSAEYTDEERRLIEYTTPYFEEIEYIPVWFHPSLYLMSKFHTDETRIRFHKDYEDGVFERIKYPVKFKIRGGEVTIKEYRKMHSALIVYRIMY